MNYNQLNLDHYDEYAEQLLIGNDATNGRHQKLKPNYRPKKNKDAVLAEVAETTVGLEGGFKTTYKPARFEEVWLRSSLQPFYDQTLISDVLMRVKGGKEANVYLCQAEPKTGLEWVAAKVYRPRSMRNLSNDALYREGRELAISDSGVNRRKDSRLARALKKKSDFGAQIAHSAWLLSEYGALDKLHRLGAAVPKPVTTAENAILLGYVGDTQRAAPTLHEVTLSSREVEPLFNEAMRNIELMLQNRMIHGDLSAYNILYWQGRITIIDFPQVVEAVKNRSAYRILGRDIQRVCEYFGLQGLSRNPVEITDRLWWRHVGIEPNRQPLPDELEKLKKGA